MPSTTRRKLLVATVTAGSAALAGCSSKCGQGLPFLGTDMPHDGEVATERVETVSDKATVVEFSALPESEQSLLHTAVDEGVVRACTNDDGDQGDALQSFANRLVGESCYLLFEGDHYGLWVRVADEVYAATGSPSEDDGNPCC